MKSSALNRRLTEEQRRKLVADARSLVDQYRSEMEQSFYPKRREYERRSNDDFSSRLSDNPDKQRIYDLSNYPLNIVRNVTRFMKARCGEDIFGSKPFIGIAPVGLLDAALADQLGRHGPWKLDQAQYSKIGKEGIGLAMDLGEVVQKTTHRTDRDAFEQLQLVLVHKRTGQPVLHPLVDETGQPRLNTAGEQEADYFYPEDATIQSDDGRLVFEKNPDVALDDTVAWDEVLIQHDDVTYHGLDVANVRFDSFIAPLRVPSLDQAPAVCHEFGRRVSQLRALYWDESEDTQWIFEQLKVQPDGPKTAEENPRTTYGEVSQGSQLLDQNPNVKVQEIYLHDYDVFGDGRGRNIFLVLAGDLDEPLYLEYLANVTVKGKLPFHSIAVNRIPGTWVGRGFYELYENSQNLIDGLINSIIVHNEDSADPLICHQPDATEEGKSEKRLLRGPRRTLTLRNGKSAKDAVQIIEIPDLDERTWQLVQLIMQLVQTDSGVTSAAQGDYSALPSASTATGISSILQSASTLHRMLTEDLKDGYEPAILFGLETIYARQDKDETFRYLEGHATEILSLAGAKALRDITLNVRLLLTRFQLREQRESAQAIIKDILPQWIAVLQASGLPTLDVAQNARPLFVQVAKGSDILQAETVFTLPERPILEPPPEEAPPSDEKAGDQKPKNKEPGTNNAPPLPTNVIPDPAPPAVA